MKKTIMLTSGLLIAGAFILNGCKDDEVIETPPVVVVPEPTVPKSENVVLHLPLNGNSNASVGTVSQVTNTATYIEDRKGGAGGAAYLDGNAAAGTGQIIEISGGNFVPSSTTISCWYQIDPATYGPGSRVMFGIASKLGYFMELAGDQAWCKFVTSHKVTPDPMNHYFGQDYADPNGNGDTSGIVTFDYLGSLSGVIGGSEWHQLVMTYDELSALKTIYVDGLKLMQVDLNSAPSDEWHMAALKIADQAEFTGVPVTGIVQNLTLGYFCSPANTAVDYSIYSGANNTWKGGLDDFRIWNVALSESEVTALYDFEK
jgi:hypothetical protein